MNSFRTKVFALWAASLLSVSVAAALADVAGEWEITLETDADTMKPRLSLEQDEESVSGTYKDEFGTAAVSGTVKDKEISLQFRADIPNENLIVTYTGTVEGNTMRGRVKFGELGEGTFIGRKQ